MKLMSENLIVSGWLSDNNKVENPLFFTRISVSSQQKQSSPHQPIVVKFLVHHPAKSVHSPIDPHLSSDLKATNKSTGSVIHSAITLLKFVRLQSSGLLKNEKNKINN